MSAPLFIEIGALVEGVLAGEAVRILEIRRAGESALVTYERRIGERGTAFLNRAALAGLVPVDARPMWCAQWSDFTLGVQALALQAAAFEDRLLAVSSSNVTPLPHQVQAVYRDILPHHRLRFLLADDPGAGKTIMTGLYLKEVLARGNVTRVLIVTPGSLAEQWIDEMWNRFGLSFVELGTQHLTSAAEAPALADAGPLMVARLDQLARNDDLLRAVLREDFHVVVVDEAHKMSARGWGRRTIFTKRYMVGKALAAVVPHLLLLTATPHNGKPEDFARFMELLDVQLDQRRPVLEQAPVRRLVKEQLVHADGTALFPPRVASTLGYSMTRDERRMYEAVTKYVAEEMNRVMDESVRRRVGFAMMVLQRRLASSPEAILRSLERRFDLLQSLLERAEARDADLVRLLAGSLDDDPSLEDEDDNPSDDSTSTASAARTPGELRAELLVLERLIAEAYAVRLSGVDQKWEALKAFLTSVDSRDDLGRRRKVIVFTEHRDTLTYLLERLDEVLQPGEHVAVIHGQTPRHERRQAQHDFNHDPQCGILLATDAAGEGVNLQVANLMVNYDIPWNPNHLEQRFGRIHRIGQDRTCYLWNLVATDTREGYVFKTLLEKLAVQREALGDRVFDVLGDVLSGADLSRILTEAVRTQNLSDALSVLEQRLDHELGCEVARRAASTTEFSPDDLAAIQRRLEWAKALDPQPVRVPTFARSALLRLGAEVHTVRPGTWSVPYVPQHLASEPGVARSYARLHLDRANLAADDAGAADFLAPGHPLLNALTTRVLADLGPSLRDGALLQDPFSKTDYLLITVQTEGFPQTFQVEREGTPTRVAVDAALDLHPTELVDAAWATELADGASLPGGSVLAIAAVRGTAEPHQAAYHRRLLDEAARRLAGEGTVTRGMMGAGFDLAVERGSSVEFITIDRSLAFGPHQGLPLEQRASNPVPPLSTHSEV